MTSFEQTVLNVAGVQNGHIHTIWLVLLYICGVMYLLVVCFLIWALARAHTAQQARRGPEAPGMSMALYAWIGLVVAGLFGITLTSYAVDRAIFLANQPRGLSLKVTSQQWWWSIEYENDDPSRSFQTANEIHLPVNVPVTVSLRSPDVVHSFWVPNLHGKQDLIPGRDTDIHLHPTRVGVFRGQCAEFCGAQHANMALFVIVESQQDFDRWRADQLQSAREPSDGTTAHGRDVFMTTACALCHTIRGTDAGGVTGPDLTHVASRVSLAAGALNYSRGNLAAWIADPQGIKPGNHMPKVGLPPDDLQSVIAYLDGLK